MCLAAIYWADIRSVYFCADRLTAERAGFMDDHLYREVALPADSREVRTRQLPLEEMDRLLDEWEGMEGKVLY
jgi:guanine deaminase